MRRYSAALAVAALATLASACGNDPQERLSLRTPPERSVAKPLPEVERAGRQAERAARQHPTHHDAQRLRPVLRAWGRALRRDRTGRAARYFALPAIVAQGRVLMLETTEQVRAFNEGIPCGARLLRVQEDGRFVVGTFRLTRRPQHSCPARGRVMRVAVVVRDHRIAEWREVPKGAEPGPARPENAPDPPPRNVS
jgi:hypothetical protein